METARAAELAAIHATEPLLVCDAEQVRFVNQAFANLVGVPAHDIIGRGIDQIITILAEPMVVERLRNALRQRQSYRGEANCQTAGGLEVPIELTVVPVVGAHEDDVLYIGSARDLRQQKRMEHQLWQSQRLDAVARLADRIAHEMNEAIQVIGGYANLARSGLGNQVLSYDELNDVLAASQRASTLLREVLEFARVRESARGTTDLNAVVADWEEFLRGVVGRHIRLIVDLAPELPPILADPGELRHILINLAANARDAIGEAGTLTISTHAVTGTDPQLAFGDVDEHIGAYVVLTVTDTGAGMSAETKANLFQPFFTTKGPDHRGLGLVTVQEIVREASGLLWIRSHPGQGTAVEIHFPALPGRSATIESTPVSIPAGHGQETILLVDDDTAVLKVAQRGLERYGYQVLTAESAAQATAIAAERGGEVALLVTDIMMPGQRGTDLARELLGDWPHLRVLFISGYPGEGTLDQLRKMPYLSKPFTSEELANAVRSVCDA